MKTKLLAVALLAGSSLFAGPRIGVRVGVGPVYGPAYGYGYYAPAPAYVAPAYVAPAPVYAAPAVGWGGGYWITVGGRRVWHDGYRGGAAFRGERFGRGFRR